MWARERCARAVHRLQLRLHLGVRRQLRLGLYARMALANEPADEAERQSQQRARRVRRASC